MPKYHTKRQIRDDESFARLYNARDDLKTRVDALEATMLVISIERAWLMKAYGLTELELAAALERDGITFTKPEVPCASG